MHQAKERNREERSSFFIGLVISCVASVNLLKIEETEG
jgi:hypothetical protein